jgi:small conductance mechanosensitive channel
MLSSTLLAAQGSEPAPETPVNIQDVLPSSLDIFIDDWQPEQVTGEDLLVALILIASAIVLAFIIGRLLRFSLDRWSSLPPFGSELAGRLTTYLIILIGVIIALESIGLTLGPLVILVAVVVMGVWAMRPLLQNTGAGLLLQARGPFQPGEEIQSVGFEGEVEELDARVVQIRTPDGRRVYIPNQEVVNAPIVNLTELGERRSTFEIGVAYDTDLDQAVAVIREALAGAPGVFADPQPEAFVFEFDDSNITISAWFWHSPEIYNSWKVKDEATRATVRALRGVGIVVSFPRRTLAWAE